MKLIIMCIVLSNNSQDETYFAINQDSSLAFQVIASAVNSARDRQRALLAGLALEVPPLAIWIVPKKKILVASFLGPSFLSLGGGNVR